MTLGEALREALHDRLLGVGDIGVFARPDPSGSGSYRELKNPLPVLLEDANRYELYFVQEFKDVDWKLRGLETDLMAIGAVTPVWVMWAKYRMHKCPHCGSVL